MRQESYDQRNRALLTRANPLAKLAAAALLTAALALSVDWVSATVALLLELALLPLVGLAPGRLLRRGWPLLAAALTAGYGTSIFAEDSGQTLLEFGLVTVSEGSLATGVAVMFRGLAVALPGILMMASTDPTDLADALAQKARLPHRFVLGALAAMRLVGLMVEEWRVLGMARRARGVGYSGSPYSRLRAGFGQAFGLLVQAIRRATRLAVTMEARGFGGVERTWARVSHYSVLDLWVILGSVAIGAAAVGSAVVLGTWQLIGS